MNLYLKSSYISNCFISQSKEFIELFQKKIKPSARKQINNCHNPSAY